ncbi:alpha/beta hydrolase [Candidatus Gracilibacteria bacterium]|nr:alpha/beta hydrolase [Candidatus Gracilibacteria bacterium]
MIIFIISGYFYLGSSSFLSVFLVILSFINLVGWSYPIYKLYELAGEKGISLSVIKNLKIQVNRGTPQLDRSLKYTTAGGQDLFLDVYEATNTAQGNIKPLIMIHGGGFVEGERSQEPEWIEFFNHLGYTVFDIEYRLATLENHTWDLAASDINSAIIWVGLNQERYNLDMSELVLAGSSAGASLALQASYGGESVFPSNNVGEYFPAEKIVAYFPATTMEPLWNRDTKFLDISSREVGMKYTGGGPSDVPERYNRINTVKLANRDAPETLVIHGSSDHLIPADTILPLEQRLTELGVENEFVFIPFAEHGFTYFVGNFGFQIAKGVTQDFLQK